MKPVPGGGWQSTSLPPPDTIKARRLEIVDSAGETIVVIGQEENVKGGSALMLKGSDASSGRMLLFARDDGISQFSMATPEGRPLYAVLAQGGTESRASMTFLEGSGRSGAGISADDRGGLDFDFKDEGQAASRALRTSREGVPHLTIVDDKRNVQFDSARR